MNFRALAFVSAALAFATQPLLAQGEGTFDFNLKGDNFSFAIPSGYCLPTDEQKPFTDRIASADPINYTLLSVQLCGSFGEDYLLVKSPKAMPPLDIPKSAFLDLMTQHILSEQGQKDFKEGMAKGGEGLDKEFDGEIKIGSGTVDYSGTDEECLYMSGTLVVETAGGAAPINIAACMTLIDKRQFTVAAYDFAEGGIPMKALKDRSRDAALRITPR